MTITVSREIILVLGWSRRVIFGMYGHGVGPDSSSGVKYNQNVQLVMSWFRDQEYYKVVIT